jgi:spore maturation protein CgeB
VDAPATLDRMSNNPEDQFWNLAPQYDIILTYGGGDPVATAYKNCGAKNCIPVYNALDTTTHFPVEQSEKFAGDLGFLGNRLPDREKRVDEFFLKTARYLPEKQFVLGGSGWQDKKMPDNVRYVGHVYTKEHNAFNCTPKTVLNISRESMARYGFSPATRIFEAAGAGACIITDYWEGIGHFLTPGVEVLVANTGREVADILNDLSINDAARIGKAAHEKVITSHTYAQRAEQVDKLFKSHIFQQKIMI